MARLRSTWRMTANLPLLPAAATTSLRVTFHELAHIWAIDHSSLLDHVCGTTNLPLYHRDCELPVFELRGLLKMHLFF